MRLCLILALVFSCAALAEPPRTGSVRELMHQGLEAHLPIELEQPSLPTAREQRAPPRKLAPEKKRGAIPVPADAIRAQAMQEGRDAARIARDAAATAAGSAANAAAMGAARDQARSAASEVRSEAEKRKPTARPDPGSPPLSPPVNGSPATPQPPRP